MNQSISALSVIKDSLSLDQDLFQEWNFVMTKVRLWLL